jgi:asparagine synthase (glutamine-hydrolysing)
LAQDDVCRSAAVLLGRVFYQEDLLARLLQSRDLRGASDAALALAAYRHLGRQGLEQLEGEFALVIWDGTRRRLWAQRDPFGCWPLFWSATNSAVAVSTSLEALAAEQPGWSFNLDALAEYLMQPLPASELPCEQTAYQGLQRVLPGTIVEFDNAGQVTRHTYWDWMSRIGRTEVATLEEAGEQFASRLRQAVRQRLPKGGSLGRTFREGWIAPASSA